MGVIEAHRVTEESGIVLRVWMLGLRVLVFVLVSAESRRLRGAFGGGDGDALFAIRTRRLRF